MVCLPGLKPAEPTYAMGYSGRRVMLPSEVRGSSVRPRQIARRCECRSSDVSAGLTSHKITKHVLRSWLVCGGRDKPSTTDEMSRALGPTGDNSLRLRPPRHVSFICQAARFNPHRSRDVLIGLASSQQILHLTARSLGLCFPFGQTNNCHSATKGRRLICLAMCPAVAPLG